MQRVLGRRRTRDTQFYVAPAREARRSGPLAGPFGSRRLVVQPGSLRPPPSRPPSWAGLRPGRAENHAWIVGIASSGAFQLAPAAGTVVRDDLSEHRDQGALLDLLASAVGDRSCRLVGLTGGDDAVRIGDDAAVVEEEVDVILGGEQRADVALEDEVRLHAAFDRLDDFRVGAVDQIAELLAELLLPVGQPRDIAIDSRIALIGGRGCH